LALGERIRREIAGGEEGGAAASVTVSVGIASCDAQCRDYDAMFHRADQRLYQAKAEGRNCVVGERPLSTEASVRLAYSG
jgi:diguanylate cyclase (GGDEF)-like protein